MNMENKENPQVMAGPESDRAKPHRLPKPTYWPFFLALGLTFLFWGLLTTWIILFAGLVVFAVALWGWINILRHG